MQNIEEVRKQLAEVFLQLKSGEIEPKTAKELTNAAGKIINSVKVELDENEQLGIKEAIPFLRYDSKDKLNFNN